MWFRAKAKNRRFKRDQVLEVKVSAQKAAALRWRRFTTGLSVVLVAAAAWLFIWKGGSWVLDRLAYDNEAFAIQSIVVHTDGALATERLRQWTEVQLGDNLLALDLGRIKRNLELVPLIKAAAVERVLPHTLKITVTEREPMAKAQVLLPRPDNTGYEVAVYYLDDEGYVMLPLPDGAGHPEPSFTNDNLSVLSGLSRSDLRPGRPAESPQVFAALRLIEAFERSPMIGLADLAWIDLSRPEVLQVTTGQGSKVTLATDHFDLQLRRWRLVYDYAQKMGKTIASVDLSVTNNVPALWADAGAGPPAKPKTVKPFHYRRKHV